jgi:hypothetical protein
MAFTEDLVTLLAGVGTLGTSVFVSTKAVLPTDKTTAFLLLTATGGTSPIRTQNSVDAPAYVRPHAQIMAHAPTYQEAFTLATAAYNALVGVRNRLVGTVWYREINPIQEPFDLGLDATGRACVAFNVAGIKRPS